MVRSAYLQEIRKTEAPPWTTALPWFRDNGRIRTRSSPSERVRRLRVGSGGLFGAGRSGTPRMAEPGTDPGVTGWS
jgi:hypothetical protein